MTVRLAFSRRGIELTRAFQAAAEIEPADASRVAGRFLRVAPIHAASIALLLLQSSGSRPLAVVALESRRDVRALFLLDPNRVLDYVGGHLAPRLEEAANLCRSIEARYAAEAALQECLS